MFKFYQLYNSQYFKIKRQMMISMYLLFVKTQLTDIILKGKAVDVMKKSHLFIKELQQQTSQKILLHFTSQTHEKHKQLRILSVLAIMMIKNGNFLEIIGENLKVDHSNTQWLTKHVINPFKQWINACNETSEYYKQIRKESNSKLHFIDRASYLVTLLKRMLNILKNIPKMGRYILLNKENDVYQTFSEAILALANHHYAILKSILDQFLQEYQGRNSSINSILKWIFQQVILDFNQTLTSVTTCKYFSFYGKGITAKLIRQAQYIKKYREKLSFLGSNYEQNCAKKSKKQMQKQFFPEDGSFNAELYMETLQTLEESFYETNLSNRSLCFDKSYSKDSKYETNKRGYDNILQYC